jgi:hypothetical protein
MVTRTATKSPQDDSEPSSVDAASTTEERGPTADASSSMLQEHPAKVKGSDEDTAAAGLAISSTLDVPVVAHEEDAKMLSNDMETSSKSQEQIVQAVDSEPKL